MSLSFYRGKRVLVTGHTGFKGTWLIRILVNAGAAVCGYSRCSAKTPNFFEMTGLANDITHVRGDVRDFDCLLQTFQSFSPEIVFHLAAQPIVRESYADPRTTYETNVMGTVNVLEAVRKTQSVRSVLIVTTDKVYRNNEWPWGYREQDELDGYDPYSNSKSCAELIVHSFRNSFFDAQGVAVSTGRAGNVLGGGDFAKDRIIPDCMRAVQNGESICVRNPHSIRPYQHVLEPLFAYLLIAERQYADARLAGCYNIGPDDSDCISTGELVEKFCKLWGEGASWFAHQDRADAPHEANYLKLDCNLMRSTFGWRPKWHIEECLELVCRFGKIMNSGSDIVAEMGYEIQRYPSS